MKLQVGDIVEGVISGIQLYGVFVKMHNDQVGFIHISEIRNEFIVDIHSLFQIGQSVKAKVVEINDKGQIFLSMKKLNRIHNHVTELETESGFKALHRAVPKWIKTTYDDMFKK